MAADRAKVVGNMATYPGRAGSLEPVVRRIAPQLDRLNIVLNEYDEIPSWMNEIENVAPILPKEDFKDVGKFVPEVGFQDIVILLDDDLLYPEDYVAEMIWKAEDAGILSGGGAIGGLHGTIYRSAFQERSLRVFARVLLRGAWRTGSFRRVFNYWEELDRATVVEQIGTGTAILPGRLMPHLNVMRRHKRRTDVGLASWAFENHVPIIALPRPNGWLTCCEQDESIYASYTQRMPKDLSAEIARYARRNKQAGQVWAA